MAAQTAPTEDAGFAVREKLGSTAIETVVWMRIVFSIVLADIVLQVQEQQRSRPAARAAKAGAA
jgi:hypothetical protein